MNIDPKILKIFLLTLIFMLLLSVAAIISKAEEPRFKGGIDTAIFEVFGKTALMLLSAEECHRIFQWLFVTA